jgi:hypothetical protein
MAVENQQNHAGSEVADVSTIASTRQPGITSWPGAAGPAAVPREAGKEVTPGMLAAHGFLRGMPREQLAGLAPAASLVTMPARHRLFEDGGYATHFWLVRSGSVALDLHVPGKGWVVIETTARPSGSAARPIRPWVTSSPAGSWPSWPTGSRPAACGCWTTGLRLSPDHRGPGGVGRVSRRCPAPARWASGRGASASRRNPVRPARCHTPAGSRCPPAAGWCRDSCPGAGRDRGPPGG